MGVLALLVGLVAAADGTENAAANGETRTLVLYNDHTQETGSFTFRSGGSYDSAVLKQLDWFLRDWRLDEPTRMDPKLFDIIWQVYREVGGSEPVQVLSGYRSPGTNAMLRRRSKAVSEHSQHMQGKAMDFRIPGIAMSRVREIGMRLQNGGVGWYAGAQFVHLDAGSVRSWPRMSGGELARLFPDGKTVHIPRDGKPLPGYEEAKATILARGGTVAGYSAYAEGEDTGPRKSLWATLFGGSDDEDSDFYRSSASRTRVASANPGRAAAAYAPAWNSDDAGTRGGVAVAAAPAEPAPARGSRRQAVALAALPTGAAPGFESRAPDLLSPDRLGGRAGQAEGVPVLAASPMPPRRPEDVSSLVAAAPLPPVRPVALAMAGGAPVLLPNLRGEARPPGRSLPAEADDRAALRSLFEAAATPTRARRAEVTTSRARVQPLVLSAILGDRESRIRIVFSSATLDAPPPGSFSGSAVAPLAILR